jgi:hypothetical protein
MDYGKPAMSTDMSGGQSFEEGQQWELAALQEIEDALDGIRANVMKLKAHEGEESGEEGSEGETGEPGKLKVVIGVGKKPDTEEEVHNLLKKG